MANEVRQFSQASPSKHRTAIRIGAASAADKGALADSDRRERGQLKQQFRKLFLFKKQQRVRVHRKFPQREPAAFPLEIEQ